MLLIGVAWGANGTAQVANLLLQAPMTPIEQRPAHALTSMVATMIAGAGIGAAIGTFGGKRLALVLVWAVAGAIAWTVMASLLFPTS